MARVRISIERTFAVKGASGLGLLARLLGLGSRPCQNLFLSLSSGPTTNMLTAKSASILSASGSDSLSRVYKTSFDTPTSFSCPAGSSSSDAVHEREITQTHSRLSPQSVQFRKHSLLLTSHRLCFIVDINAARAGKRVTSGVPVAARALGDSWRVGLGHAHVQVGVHCLGRARTEAVGTTVGSLKWTKARRGRLSAPGELCGKSVEYRGSRPTYL